MGVAVRVKAVVGVRVLVLTGIDVAVFIKVSVPVFVGTTNVANLWVGVWVGVIQRSGG